MFASLSAPPWEVTAFALSLAFYHVSEFAIAATFNRATLSSASWLVSKPYCLAMTAACVEYVLERALLPTLKGHTWVCVAGLVMAVLGDGLRKTAQITAAHNFTHQIVMRRRQEHRVVRCGVYRYARHPGYLGWLCWSVGTQVLLCNPVCIAGFAVTGWHFFRHRIPFEEATLRAMFPGEYAEYASRTRTWIPGIR
mmetsp:Transcript_24745/g.39763  ORF Transcript_24745/g.39763 Transcript_24745/m.39763 type:complete len:196 (+) Transcript_24745:176-763(+)